MLAGTTGQRSCSACLAGVVGAGVDRDEEVPKRADLSNHG